MNHQLVIERPLKFLKDQLRRISKQNAKVICSSLLALVFLAEIFCAFHIRDLSTTYSVSQFLPQDDPILKRENDVKKLFNLSETPGFLATVTLGKAEKGTWLDRERVSRLSHLFDRLQAMHNVKKIVGLGTIDGMVQDAHNLRIGPLLKLTPQDQRATRILNDPLLSPSLVSKDGRTLLISIDTGFSTFTQITTAENETKRIVAREFPQTQVEIGGVMALQTEMGNTLFKELRIFVVLAFIISFLVLMTIFSSLSGVWATLFMIGFANLLCVGGMAALHIPFTVLSTTIPILVNITVLAISTHTLLRLNEDCQKDGSFLFFHFTIQHRFEKVFRTLQHLALPNFLSAFTTCIGFFTLATIPVPVIRNYGIATAVCVMATWFLTHLLMLAILPFIEVPRVRHWTGATARWSLLILKYRTAVCAVIAIGTAFLAIQGLQLNHSPRLFDDLPLHEPTRAATEHMDRKMGGVLPLEIVIEAPESNVWTNPDSIQRMHHLLTSIRKLGPVGSANGISDFLDSPMHSKRQSNKQSNNKAQTLTRQKIAETFFIYSMDPNNPLRGYLSNDGKIARISVRMHDVPAEEIYAAVHQIVSASQAEFPTLKIDATGMAINAHLLNGQISQDLIFGFWQALLLIGILLVFVFRSLKWSLVACLPNLVPPAVLLGSMALSGVAVKPGIALVFSIALGLSFNNTVYLLERLRRQKHKKGSGKAIQKAFYLESNPCVVSTLVIFSGFTVFLGSYFSLNRYFGAFMLLSILGGLVGDLIFLPAFISIFPRLLSSKNTPEVKISDMERYYRPASLATFSIILFLLFGAHAHAADDAQSILKKVQRQIASVDEVANIKLSIIESDGSKKDRELMIKRKTGSKEFVLARLEQPGDLRGTSFLSVYSKGKDEQWLYLPSSKQTRKILGSNKEAGFLGSEITYEDLSASQAEGAKMRLLKDENYDNEKCSVIDTQAGKGKSSYSHVKTWVSQNKFLPLKAEYYDKKNKLVKLVTFENYKQYGKKTWRAQTMHVKNLKTRRGTDLVLTKLAVNKGLSEQDFSVQALSND